MADSNFAFFVLILILPLSLLILLYLIVRPSPVKVPIKGRHVFITGGSSGIGLAMAHQAATESARVTILARNLDKLEEAKQSIRLSTGIDVAISSADVRDFEALKKAIEEAGPIDVLICNQGVSVPQKLEEQTLEEVKFMIDVNLMGTFNLVKAALPGMKNRSERGPASIAIISSQAGQVGIYGYTAYSASKFGLKGLAEALQQEVIADNIHVSLIFPPDTDTPGFLEGGSMAMLWPCRGPCKAISWVGHIVAQARQCCGQPCRCHGPSGGTLAFVTKPITIFAPNLQGINATHLSYRACRLGIVTRSACSNTLACRPVATDSSKATHLNKAAAHLGAKCAVVGMSQSDGRW